MAFLTNTTCLHVSNLERSIKWYVDGFGVSVIKRLDTEDYLSAFIAPDSPNQPHAGLPLAERDGVIELRQLKDMSPDIKIFNGNTDPYRGFGHICFAVSNIAEYQKKLLELGVEFKKRVEDGLMKTIAFVLDPDQYWVELIENAINKKEGEYDLSSNRMNHTMVRVKDPQVSVKFYTEVLGMRLLSVREITAAKFTLYFLGYDSDPDFVSNSETKEKQGERQSIIELTHNWGTEKDDSFDGYYIFGNDDKVIGFDHFSISCRYATHFIKALASNEEVKFIEKKTDTATITDPDGWKIEIHSYDYLQW